MTTDFQLIQGSSWEQNVKCNPFNTNFKKQYAILYDFFQEVENVKPAFSPLPYIYNPPSPLNTELWRWFQSEQEN